MPENTTAPAIRFHPQRSESGPDNEIVWAPHARERRFLEDLEMRRWFAEHGPAALAADPDLAAVVELSCLPIVRREVDLHDLPLGLSRLQDLLELVRPILVKLDRDARGEQVHRHDGAPLDITSDQLVCPSCQRPAPRRPKYIDPASLKSWTLCEIRCLKDNSVSYREVRKGLVRSNSAERGHALRETHKIARKITTPQRGGA